VPGAKTRVTARKRKPSSRPREREPPAEAARSTRLTARERQARVRSLLQQHVAFVERTLRRRGVPSSELADQVQRTFIVAARRLESMQAAAERPFLFAVALNLASRARRTLARRREVPAEDAPEPIEALATPEHLVERKRTWQRLARIIEEMHESLRAVLVLAVFEEMSFTDIAADLDIPRGTVASRLRRARQLIREQAAALERAPEGEA
jgi:RNA polymerase sigma-70 factor (ECF subfamily)